jgi:uncharacterized protein YcbK (DUF882 family)
VVALLAVIVTLGAVAGAAQAGEPGKLAALAAKHGGKLPARGEKDKEDARLRKLIGKPPQPVVTLHNIWTGETLAVDVKPGATVDPKTWDTFLRCHFTNHETDMDPRLVGVLVGAAQKFKASRIDIVSGFRSPKFNLMLRKKGHEVARDSQHSHGHAVDFRVPGVRTTVLLAYVKSLGLGGAGFYPESAFVHADTGPVRYWTGR